MARAPVFTRWAFLFGAAASFLAPRTASAHLGLATSTPANGAHLTTAPRSLHLTFTQAVEGALARLRLVGPAGTDIGISPLRQPGDSGQIVAADILAPLEAGRYTIEWRVVGKDGHPVRGTIAFSVAPGAAGLAVPGAGPPARGEAGAAVTAPGQEAPPAAHHDPRSMPAVNGFGAESLGYVAIRWLNFTAILVAIGVLAFRFVVLGRLQRTDAELEVVFAMQQRATTVGVWAGMTLLLTAALRLYAQSLAMHGADEALSGALVMTMLSKTVWGWGWLLHVAAAAGLLVGFSAAGRGKSSGWQLAAFAGCALAVTPALSGHAAAMPERTTLAIFGDTLHVIGAAGWLGSLALVLAVGLPVAMRAGEGRRGRVVAALVNAFSPTAFIFAGLAALTGVLAAWLHLGFTTALWQSDYGRTLLIKVALLSVVLATGAYNWLRVRPALGDDVGASRIRRSAAVELAVGVLVVIVTAVLVATPPPMEMAGSAVTAAVPVAQPAAGR